MSSRQRRGGHALPPSPSGGTTVTSSRSRSPATSASSSSSSSAHLEGENGSRPCTFDTDAFVRRSRHYKDENVRAVLLHQLPSSPKQLLRRLEQQQHEIRLLQDENTTLKAREVEVSSLTVFLQDRINATQAQVDSLKTQVLLQLSNPITEAEYDRVESLPEAQRDLVDVIKLGIYRQLHSLRTSQQAATRRAAELSGTVAELQQDNADMKVRLTEYAAQGDTEKEKWERQTRQLASAQARISELEGVVAAVESRNKSMYVDQEQHLSAKLTAQMKTDEVARLAVRLEESEMDTQRYRANAECTEQKLDILKAEYYELKLDYGQRVLKLESALRASEEKLKTLGDLEMESELFLSNLAANGEGEMGFCTGPRSGDGDGAVGGAAGGTTSRTSAYESWLALPRSRKLAHSLVVTKRCLHLENKVSALEHDLAFRDTQLARLQVALDGARDALHNINSPYVLVERAMEELTGENEALKQKLRIAEHEKRELQAKLQHYGANMRVLTQHRKELLHIKKLLRQLGMREGFVFPSTNAADEAEDGTGAGDANRQAKVPAEDVLKRSRTKEGGGAPSPSCGVMSPTSQLAYVSSGATFAPVPSAGGGTETRPPSSNESPPFASFQPIEIQS